MKARLSPHQVEALEAVFGLALVTAGVAMVSVPAALIVAGLAVVAFAVWPRGRKR